MVGRPAVPEVIWARPERAGRGPKPAFSRADIAAAAVRIADAEGIDAVSMRKVAAEIGCGTMSLYNYVPRKEDLLELMVDAISAEYDLTAPPSADWRAAVVAMAHQTRALMQRHPWVPGLMSGVYGFSPNVLAFLEHELSLLDGLDVPFGEKMELIALVQGVVTTFVANEIATAEHSRSLPWTEEQEKAARTSYLISQISTGKYPRMAAGFAEDPGPADLDVFFERALGRVLGSFGS
ncbi:TetR/AcrR family transcriptional regulator [Streptomyces sp. 24-1644]|uniref:TetR/AcrR family transcriptional regulator n=1 Tax=Streptomyces sp. 24-1644 TaxID=3457315 RepID=UPI003FA7DBB0